MPKPSLLQLVALSLVGLAPLAAQAQSPEPFYKGKTVEIYVGFSAGGGFDTYARLLARHLSKHIPGNPTVLPRNMEGAASLRLANWLYNAAPKDGTVFGTIGPGVPFDPLLGGKGAQFDPVKFSWIGSANNDVPVCVAWHASGVQVFEDLLTRELTMGGVGVNSDTDQVPKAVNAALGTKMRVISGYPGGNDINLAMERGEVGGRCAWSWSSIKATNRQWIDDRKIHLLFQMSLRKHADLPDVPLLTDLVKTSEHKQMFRFMFARQVIGRPFLAPPEIPPDRLAMLRQAFNAAMRDPEFLAEADKAQLEIKPVPGEEVERLVAEVVATPPEVLQRLTEMLNAK